MSKSMMNQVFLLALETTAYTEATITNANAMLVRDITPKPVNAEFVPRNLIKPYFGSSGSVKLQGFSTVEVTVELAGSGAAGTAPKFGPMLVACGRAQTLNSGVSAVYSPVSTGEKSATIHYYLDGIKHVMVGCKGSARFTLEKGIPVAIMSYTGFEATITDAAPPSGISYSGFVAPVAVNNANTTFTLHGEAVAASSLTLDDGAEIQYRNLINSESVAFTNRNVTGSTVFEYDDVSTKNWFAAQSAGTLDALEMVHGTTAGNIVEIDAPKVQITNIDISNDQNIAMLSATLELQPNTGNDELILTFR